MRNLSGFPIQHPWESVADGIKIVGPLKWEIVVRDALGADVRAKVVVGKVMVVVAVKLLKQNDCVAEGYDLFVVKIAYSLLI